MQAFAAEQIGQWFSMNRKRRRRGAARPCSPRRCAAAPALQPVAHRSRPAWPGGRWRAWRPRARRSAGRCPRRRRAGAPRRSSAPSFRRACPESAVAGGREPPDLRAAAPVLWFSASTRPSACKRLICWRTASAVTSMVWAMAAMDCGPRVLSAISTRSAGWCGVQACWEDRLSDMGAGKLRKCAYGATKRRRGQPAAAGAAAPVAVPAAWPAPAAPLPRPRRPAPASRRPAPCTARSGW